MKKEYMLACLLLVMVLFVKAEPVDTDEVICGCIQPPVYTLMCHYVMRTCDGETIKISWDYDFSDYYGKCLCLVHPEWDERCVECGEGNEECGTFIVRIETMYEIASCEEETPGAAGKSEEGQACGGTILMSVLVFFGVIVRMK